MEKDTKILVMNCVNSIEDFFVVESELFSKVIKCILKLENEVTHIKSSIKVLISKSLKYFGVHNHP